MALIFIVRLPSDSVRYDGQHEPASVLDSLCTECDSQAKLSVGTTGPQALGMMAAFQNAEHLDAHRSALLKSMGRVERVSMSMCMPTSFHDP